MKRIILCITLLAFATPAVAADFSYSGSSTIGTAILQAGAADAFNKKGGSKLASIDQPGSGKGIQALLDGKVSFAGASRPLKAEEKKKS